MKIEEPLLTQIVESFQKMESKNDFIGVLNLGKVALYGDKAKPFTLKQVSYYANPNVSKTRYRQFSIKKKSGAERTIHAPVKGLKEIQSALAVVLQCMFTPSSAATGFIWGKSIVDNAKVHVARKYVFNLDLKDFFHSVDQARVWACLKLKPFNLIDNPDSENEYSTSIKRFKTDHGELLYYKVKKGKFSLINDKKGNLERYKRRLIGHIPKPDYMKILFGGGNMAEIQEYDKKVSDVLLKDILKYLKSELEIKSVIWQADSRLRIAGMIASLCCTELEVKRKINGEWQKVRKNVLPQGAPTSPVITNIVCQRLDYLLSAVAKRFELNYTRYADDLTFSGEYNAFRQDGEFMKELHRIIADQNFDIKESKTRLQKDGYRKEVTGLLVNETINVQKRYIKQLRMWLYFWERYGYEKASSLFLPQYLKDKGNIIKGKPNMDNVLLGKLEYLRMVVGDSNSGYVKLKERFDKLFEYLMKSYTRKDYLNEVLEIFSNKGLVPAMNFYKKES